ncbi:hypothetical protein WUBG_05947 [Wuchereria bancrofti]|uniref:Glycosyl-hydrolase family 116 N-terminal domain-containing protein n=1 Tax=Wuchereria bancrofti TaxID=6293 RepID=J9ELV6_WUCBA|nr:hypothetical protein WUBG_05947 [Wuchereria bancrofti]
MLVLAFASSVENAVQRQLGIAVSVEMLISAKTKVTSCMEYVLVWDMPIVQFGGGIYRRRHTRIFGDQGHASPTICAYSLTRNKE